MKKITRKQAREETGRIERGAENEEIGTQYSSLRKSNANTAPTSGDEQTTKHKTSAIVIIGRQQKESSLFSDRNKLLFNTKHFGLAVRNETCVFRKRGIVNDRHSKQVSVASDTLSGSRARH